MKLSTEKPQGYARITWFEGLRGLAAFWVLLFHLYRYGSLEASFSAHLPDWLNGFFHYGYLGVDIFFFISGFVIAYSMRKVCAGWSSTRMFVLRRAIRLCPTYWSSVVLYALVAYLSAVVLPSREVPVPSWDHIAAHLTYFQTWMGYKNFMPIYWTLLCEVKFYIFFIIVFAVLGSREKGAHDGQSPLSLSVFALSALYSLSVYVDWLPAFYPMAALNFWFMFACGMFCYHSLYHKSRLIYVLYSIQLLAIGFALSRGWDPKLFTLLIVCGLTHIGHHFDALSRWLSWRWAQFLGMISYSLYVYHDIVFPRFINLNERLWYGHALYGVTMFISSIVLCIVFSYVMYCLIEKPSIRWTQKVKYKSI